MGETGILLSILGLLAAGGIAYVASSSSTPAPAAPGAAGCTTGALPAGYTWQLTSQIVHGDHVRISMTPGTFQTVAFSLNMAAGGGITAWTNLLAQPQVAAVFGSGNVCAWAPGDALPVDWPTDDIDDATEYHAEFVYQGQVALPTSSLPLPVSVWRATPPAASITGTASPGATTQGNIGKASQHGNPPSTAPQTVHLTAPMANPNVLSVGDTLPGTPITITIDGGGSFQVINAWDDVYDAQGINVVSTKQTPNYPGSGAAFGSVFVFTTTTVSGGVLLTWTDANGSAHQTTITYG